MDFNFLGKGWVCGSLKTHTRSQIRSLFCLGRGGDVLVPRLMMILSFKFHMVAYWLLIAKYFWRICYMSMFRGKKLVFREIELLPLSCFCCAGWKQCSKDSEKAERGQPLMETLPRMTTASCYFWHIDILWIKQMHGHTWLLGIVLFFCVHTWDLLRRASGLIYNNY